MVELHGQRVLEDVPPPRLERTAGPRTAEQDGRRSAARCCRSARRADPRPARRDRSAPARGRPERQRADADARGASPNRRGPARAARPHHRDKITQASIRWIASRYCETSTRSLESRGHHPPADRALQRAEPEDRPQTAAQPLGRSSPATGTTGTAAGTPTPMKRPSRRCVHSHQKMVLNSASVMPRLTLLVLRDCLVLVELGLPRALGQRRQRPRSPASIRRSKARIRSAASRRRPAPWRRSAPRRPTARRGWRGRGFRLRWTCRTCRISRFCVAARTI